METERRNPEAWAALNERWQAAQAAIEAGDWSRAQQIGDELVELGHASGHEVRARALWAQGEQQPALEALVQGIAGAPQLARLWELLGVFQTELGLLDEADASFRNALRCPQVEKLSVGYHCALLRVRQGRLDEALTMIDALDELGADGLGLGFHVLRARLLNALGRHADAIEACNRSLALADRELGVDDAWLASLYVERGKAYWLGTGDREHALADVRAARALHPGPDDALNELDELLGDE